MDGWMNRMRRSMISKDLTKEDADDMILADQNFLSLPLHYRKVLNNDTKEGITHTEYRWNDIVEIGEPGRKPVKLATPFTANKSLPAPEPEI